MHAEVVELRFGGRAVRAPVWILPGQAEHTVTVHLGYGRSRAGRVGSNIGTNAYALRCSDSLWSGSGVEIRRVGERYSLAATQLHHQMQGRDLLRAGTLEQYRKNPDFAHGANHDAEPGLTLYPERQSAGAAWGMAIDLTLCTGCNACVVACQAENNIPVVGKNEVLRSREMHWLRIDSYFKGPPENPETYYEPVPCMQCEKAPCEVVCPVTATAHSAEGLNDMVYNRCVGTRYCSNNCPYKVRRFNFFQYSDWETESLKPMRNPDVTVRSRGVMEKCTYCVQRINHAKIEAELQGRRVRDGEITTACQQACPAQAIVFGDINEPNSRVAEMKSSPRNFSLLEELNTRPRTTYLAALRNPNSALRGTGNDGAEEKLETKIEK
jgi:molybdopterin-containing oxidoreductase family iron-sulfur binding subunit